MGKDSKMNKQAKVFSFHPTGEYYFTKGLKAYHRRDLYNAKKFLMRAYELEPSRTNDCMSACGYVYRNRGI